MFRLLLPEITDFDMLIFHSGNIKDDQVEGDCLHDSRDSPLKEWNVWFTALNFKPLSEQYSVFFNFKLSAGKFEITLYSTLTSAPLVKVNLT